MDDSPFSGGASEHNTGGLVAAIDEAAPVLLTNILTVSGVKIWPIRIGIRKIASLSSE